MRGARTTKSRCPLFPAARTLCCGVIVALLAGCITIQKVPPDEPWKKTPRRNNWGMSSSPFYIAIDGPGYFVLQDRDGNVFYSRQGSFSFPLRGEGDYLIQDNGLTVLPKIRIPHDPESKHFAWDEGGALHLATDKEVPLETLGSIRLALFWRPERLQRVNRSDDPLEPVLYRATPEAGPPRYGAPGTDGRGRLWPHYFEFNKPD